MSLYDGNQFDPPAPVVVARIRNALEPMRIVEATLVIDTGSDISLIPRWAVESIGAIHHAHRFTLQSFAGTEIETGSILADILVLDRIFQGVYPITDQPYGFLGRDILKHYCVMFDGPNETWSYEAG